jgi:hypothetical protein
MPAIERSRISADLEPYPQFSTTWIYNRQVELCASVATNIRPATVYLVSFDCGDSQDKMDVTSWEALYKSVYCQPYRI